jgi:hypothetical protein
MPLRPVKQGRFKFAFELTHRDADGRLGSKHTLRGCADAALFDHRNKHLQLPQFHTLIPVPPSREQPPSALLWKGYLLAMLAWITPSPTALPSSILAGGPSCTNTRNDSGLKVKTDSR